MILVRARLEGTGKGPPGVKDRRGQVDALAAAVLMLLAVTFFWRILFTDRAPFWGDILVAFYPAHHLWRQAVLHGDLPLWNPYIFAGMPLLGDAQYSSLYPSMLLNLVFPLHRALAVDLALHTFMLAAFMYLFLRRLAFSATSALLGAVVLAFSGFVAVRVHHVSLIRTLAWSPLLLYVVAGFSPQRGIGRSAVGIAPVLAVMVFAGHMQTVLISGLLAVVFGLWRLRTLRNTERPSTGSGLVALLAALALGAVMVLPLAAAQILPAAELVRHSDRSGGTEYGFSTSFSLPLRQLPMLFSPRLFGTPTQGIYWGEWLYWEMVGYAGVASLPLAVAGILCSQRRDRLFWLAVGLAGIGLAVGGAMPLYPIAYWIVPGLSYFRVPARFLIWYSFAVAVLAAAGLDWLRHNRLPVIRWRGLVVAMMLVTAGAVAWAAGGSGVVSAARWLAAGAMRSATFFPLAMRSEALDMAGAVAVSEGKRFLLFWVGAAVLLLVGTSREKMRSPAAALLLLLATLDLFSFGMDFYPTAPAASLFQETTTKKMLDLHGGAYRVLTTPRFSFIAWSGTMTFTSGLNDPERLAMFRNTLVPNMNVQHAVPNLLGYSPIVIRSAQEFFGLAVGQAARNGGRSRLLDFLGVRYLFTPTSLAAPLKRIPGKEFSVWRNDDALPRGYLVTRYIVEPDETRVARLLQGGLDPAKVVVLDRAPQASFGLGGDGNPGRILGRSYGLNEVSFDLQLSRPAILVLSDTYYPGWRAYVDGVRHPVYRANHAFRAVVLPARASRVEFRYEPRSVRLGLAVSGASWLILVLGVLLNARGLWRRHGSASAP